MGLHPIILIQNAALLRTLLLIGAHLRACLLCASLDILLCTHMGLHPVRLLQNAALIRTLLLIGAHLGACLAIPAEGLPEKA